MKATKLYLENRLPVAVYVTANAASGTLQITVHGSPVPGADHVPSGKAAIYPVNDELRRCMDGAKLRFELRNRTRMSFTLSPGREKMRDGPILGLEPLPN